MTTTTQKLYIPYPIEELDPKTFLYIKSQFPNIPIKYSENLKKAQEILKWKDTNPSIFTPKTAGSNNIIPLSNVFLETAWDTMRLALIGFEVFNHKPDEKDMYVLLVDYGKKLGEYDVNSNPLGLNITDWVGGVTIPMQIKFWESGQEVERWTIDKEDKWVVLSCKLKRIHIDYIKKDNKYEPTYTVYDVSVNNSSGSTQDGNYPTHSDTVVIDEYGNVEPINQSSHNTTTTSETESHTSVETGVHDVQYETGGNILDGLWWYNLRQELINILTIGVILIIAILFIKKYKK